MPAVPVFDGHIDTLVRVRPSKTVDGARSFFEESERGHVDLPRARRGGLQGAVCALCVPRPVDAPDGSGPLLDVCGDRIDFGAGVALDPAYAREVTRRLIDRLFAIERGSAGTVKVVRTVFELRRCLEGNVFAAVAHLEGAEAVAPDLENLPDLYDRGVRSIGVVWSRPNSFGCGVPFAFPGTPDTGPGLSEAGKALIRACNELGIVVDLAHMNARGFRDAAACSCAPLVVSHAAAHSLCPSSRNLTDDQLDAVGASSGVVGVNFHVAFTRPDGQSDQCTPLDAIVRHVSYIAERIGIDHVAFGSDFDGAAIPRDLGSAAGLPRLVAALGAHGFDDEALRKIARENWLRVLEATWRSR